MNTYLAEYSKLIIIEFKFLKWSKLYEEIDAMAKSLGSNLRAPFMTLSFMALLVIPDLKLSDKGLFSGNTFSFVDLEVE